MSDTTHIKLEVGYSSEDSNGTGSNNSIDELRNPTDANIVSKIRSDRTPIKLEVECSPGEDSNESDTNNSNSQQQLARGVTFNNYANLMSKLIMSDTTPTLEVGHNSGQNDKTGRNNIRKYHSKFFCEFCKKGFAFKSLLTAHLRNHTKEKPFSCDICLKAFSEKGIMVRHRRVHTGEVRFNCEYCGKGFTDLSAWKVHLKRHRGQKDFECHDCRRWFYTVRELDQHIETKRHYDRFSCYKCPVCNLDFDKKSTLNEHTKSAHTKMKETEDRRNRQKTEDPEPPKCHVCDEMFSHKSELFQHFKVHFGFAVRVH